eukprot:6568926-Pyramimonas_sp.AAC.1
MDEAAQRYEVNMPVYRRADHSQGNEWVPIVLPLDVVRSEVEADPNLPEKLDEARQLGKLPEKYSRHTAVLNAPEGVP